MDRADTLWYHMPVAARFAVSGDLGAIEYFDPIFFATYYPANSEVWHSVGILAFDRDTLSPLLNVGFLALSMLGAYCVGRPYGLGPQSLIGGLIVLGGQNLAEFQAGEALNDITGVAFVLATVAILLNAHAVHRAATPDGHGEALTVEVGPAPLAVAGIAAGLAAGTKLSFLAPALALMLGLIVIAGRGRRLRTALWFGVPALLAAGYWYLRNLIAIGNPIPFTSFGPLGLPAPERTFELRPGFSVAHYWNDPGVWADWFVPGLGESFGVLWPLTIAAFVGAGAYAFWRGRDPLIRVLGAVVVLGAIAYLFTPLTAAGEEGEPIAFQWNVRYVAPAAVVGLALLPCLPLARATERARRITLVGLCVLLVATVASLVQWQQGHVKGAVATGVAVLGGFALVRWLLDSGRLGTGAPRRWAVALAGALAVGALGAGWWEQNHYLERRYENLSPDLDLAEAVRWARDLRGARIAVAGVRGVFNQYAFYGTDLSNEVQWLGEEGPDGAYERISNCEDWRRALAEGGFTHVVTTYDPFRPDSLPTTKEARWTRADPAAVEVLADGPVSVFEIRGTPDPSSCDDLPDLDPAELNGESVNAESLLQQPVRR